MEKAVRGVVSLALILSGLLFPAAVLAATATSRWDVHLGGMIKFDAGYASQAVGLDADFAQRKSRAGTENPFDETGNQFWAAGETRLSLKVKGPPAWSALTSAFVEGDFRGTYSDSTYGKFNLRHAYMTMDWPRTRLLIGQTWQTWGIFPYLWLLKYDEDGPWNKGIRIPQITVKQQLSRGFSLTAGIASPTNAAGSDQVNNTLNIDATSDWPDFTGELVWKTDGYGKAGPWPVEFGAGGFLGSRKITYDRSTGAPVRNHPTPGPDGIQGSSFGEESLLAWGLSFRGLLPIIPGKSARTRSGSLTLVFAVFTGQNMTNYVSLGTDPYNRGGLRADFASPTVTGGWGQLVYYLTDKLSISGQVSHAVTNMSRSLRKNQPDAVYKADRYVMNVIYDINAAIRVGIEGSYVSTKYAAPAHGLADWGAFSSVRFGAYYFF